MQVQASPDIILFVTGMPQLLLELKVDDAEIARRRAVWKQPAPRYTRGVLAKFAKNANSASRGAASRRTSAGSRPGPATCCTG